MKKTFVSFAIAFSAFATAQVGPTTNPEDAAKYYYEKCNTALSSNNTKEASYNYAILNEIENGVFELKNKATKEKEYYYTEEEATKKAASGNYSSPKSISVSSKMAKEINDKVSALAKTKYDQAISAYNSKDLSTAAKKFEELGYLYNVMGYNGDEQLYNAANLFQNTKQYDDALRIYDQLIEKNYTGVTTNYYATEITSNKKLTINKDDYNYIQKDPIQSKLYKNFTTETTPDISKDIFTYAAAVANELKQYDKTIGYTEKALKKFPGDNTLTSLRFAAYSGSGKIDVLENELRNQVKANPTNTSLSYDLANAIISKKSASLTDIKEAQKLLSDNLAIEPDNMNYIRSLINAYALEDNIYREGIVSITGNSPAASAKFKAFEQNRKATHARMVPLLKMAQKADPTDLGVLRNLKLSYSILGLESQKAEIEAQIKSLGNN